MKPINTIFVLSVAFLTLACSKEVNKAEQLAELKAQYASLASQIQTLESELSNKNQEIDSSKFKMVKVEVLKPTTFNHYVEVQGRVDSDQNILVSPEIPGIIKNIYVKTGDRVNKGQVLAEIDNVMIKKSIEELQNNLELVNTIFEKQEKLWKDNVGTEVQYLQAKNNKETLENKLDQLKEQLKKSKVVAPISGVVDEVSKKVGEMGVVGFPMFRIVNFSEFKIIGELAEAYINKVNKGDEVEIYFPDLNKTIIDKIDVIGNTINPINRTFTIEVRVSGSKYNLKPNLVAYIRVKDYSRPNALVVPINTVQTSREGSFVYVADGNTVVKKTVEIDQFYGNKALVKSGLAVGDKIITFGYNDLTEGQEVKY
jgi:RND family efflux transporter MFP subunit